MRIANVMRAIRPIEKLRTTDSGPKYAYRGIDDAMNELHELLATQSLWTVTKETAYAIDAVTVRTTKGPKESWLHKHTFEIGVAGPGPDGGLEEVILGTITQIAIDSGDKGANKAFSTAWREVFLKAFCVPTEESYDNEALEQYEMATPAEPPFPHEIWDDSDRDRVLDWLAEYGDEGIGVMSDFMFNDANSPFDEEIFDVQLSGDQLVTGRRRPTRNEGRVLVDSLPALTIRVTSRNVEADQ